MPARRMRATMEELIAVDDGFVVYDEANDQLHHLNPTAALILVLCDGTNTASEIAEAVASYFSLEEPPEGEILQVLERLADEGLTTPWSEQPGDPGDAR